ncbi:MAG TPA: nucleotidyltransferase family protein [Terriglobales bacterium]|nr:nucleotidyltransferase family protein [Terriglobales bacterium]
MSRSPSFAGIVLAAGASSRMGKDKALLQYGGRTFLAGAIQLLQSACDFVLVVTGTNTDLVRPVIYENSAYLVRNWKPELGQFSSLRLGLQAALDRGRDAVGVTLVDRPPARPDTLLQLKDHFLRTAPEAVWAVVPQFDRKHGHPVIFSREMMEAFLRADPSDNAREIEHQHQDRIEYVSVDDARVAMNINTPEDYSALAQLT